MTSNKRQNVHWLLIIAIINTTIPLTASELISLPQLTSPDAWTVEISTTTSDNSNNIDSTTEPTTSPPVLTLTKNSDWLTLNINKITDSTEARMLLNNPIDIDAGTELVWNGEIKDHTTLFIHALVKDARGFLYKFNQSSRSFCRNSMFLGAHFQGGMDRTGEVLFRVFGLPDLRRQSYTAIKPASGVPQRPLQIVGLTISSEGDKLRNATVWLRNFRLHNFTHKTSALYYQFDTLESFGEISGLPSLSFGAILSWKRDADSFCIDWSIRDNFAGQPFLAGTDNLVIDQTTDSLPRNLQLTKQVEFPLQRPGVYWVRVKYRTYKKDVLDAINERDYRLYIINSQADTSQIDAADTSLSAIISDSFIGKSNIRLAPERKSLVWEAEENWLVDARFRNAQGTDCVIEVKDRSGQILKRAQEHCNSDQLNLSLDLSDLSAGILRLEASQSRDGKLIDSSWTDIGRKILVKSDAELPAIPESVPSSDEVINGEKPRFYFDAHISIPSQNDLEAVKKCMTITSTVAKNFEIRLPWSRAERLPGVYDFRETEAALDHAASLGVGVQLFLSNSAPEWVPSHFTQNPDGQIFGHNTYLFHGARLNTYHSPIIREASLRYIEAAVQHFRNHPALHSYYFLVEHPHEAPYRDWYEGFDQFTLANFRQAMLAKYDDLSALNRVWKTDFASVQAIMPPLPKSQATNQLWLDWIGWREDVVDNYMETCVSLIRRHDPKRMIMMYTASRNMAGQGVMTANGGCHEPEKSAQGAITVIDRGLPQRSEEHSVTNWAKYFPTQLDASVFSMMLGGGQNSFAKMFFPARHDMSADILDKMRQEKTHGFSRFEQFMPIWTALRPARSQAGELRYFVNRNADRLQRKSTFHGGGSPWTTQIFLDSQVPFWVGESKNYSYPDTKLLVLAKNVLGVLETKVVNELLEFVEVGGSIYMSAAAGRGLVEDDNADWHLLTSFGFDPPTNYQANLQADIFGADKFADYGRFNHKFRDLYTPGQNHGDVLAIRQLKDEIIPAVTVKSYGKGRVYVYWADTQMPTSVDRTTDQSLLRAIAKICNINTPITTGNRLTWANLLKHKDTDTWFLLLMRSSFANDDVVTDVATVTLPAGNYQVSELINGAGENSLMTAELLQTTGLTTNLKKREVAIFQLEKLPE